MPPEPDQLVFRPHGQQVRLWRERHPELLIEGAAGTGKSRNIGEFINAFCETYPRVRCLVCRKHRVRLTDSFLVTFEQKVLWPEHPALSEGGSIRYRKQYTYPNGSVIVVGGMDDPDRWFSTEWDLVFCNEATELTLDAWEKFSRAMRNYKAPWQPMIADCNPREPSNWLNQRALDGKMARIKTRHRDNPFLYNHATQRWTRQGREFLRKLRDMTHVRRKRLYEGLWCAAPGQIWEDWDQDDHIIENPGAPNARKPYGDKLPAFEWYMGSLDWGWNDPMVFQVWGVTQAPERRMYRLLEIYRRNWTTDDLADKLVPIIKDWNLNTVVCDPSRPENIELLNRRLTSFGYRDGKPVCVKADNRLEGGLDEVRRRLRDRTMFFVQASYTHPFGYDRTLEEKSRPVCTEDEIPEYQHELDDNDEPIGEKPAKDSIDHGCDATRYAAMYVWNYDESPARDKSRLEFGPTGKVLLRSLHKRPTNVRAYTPQQLEQLERRMRRMAA